MFRVAYSTHRASMDVFAHSLPGSPESQWEPLHQHLTEVGELARKFASEFGAADLAHAAGLLHDIGKSSAEFQAYIREQRDSGGDHATAGARVAMERFGPIAGKLIAYGIAGHHTGLMDGTGHEGELSSLDHRLSRKEINPYLNWAAHVSGLPDRPHISLPKGDAQYPGFDKAFLIRMLFSCLVDADFLATEGFYARSKGEQPLRDTDRRIEPRHLEALRAYMADMRSRSRDTPLNRLRADVLDHAVDKAQTAPGLFTLTVPTGGGKTLTSLRFALEHAARHGLRRVVYVIPFTSIIEQSAQVFRNALGKSAEHDILEHHSSFDWDDAEWRAQGDDEGQACIAKLRRAAENWDAPIVITTAVQFFDSLFASRTSRARKLHNLAKSVIVLDEAQTLPVHLLRPCMAVVDELARNYGASIVLCTATQPALRQMDGALPGGRKDGSARGFNVDESRELAPDLQQLYKNLKRVNVEWRKQPVTDAEIAERFEAREQMLCIVNSRRHARELFEAIGGQPGARHLTTLMCAAHRREVLADVREGLKNRQPVRLVATSLIEAGVDVDFPEVWRAAAGLDSIAQAAGRCNREGMLDGYGRTVVFTPADHGVPRAFTSFWDAARPVLDAHEDPLGLDAVTAYFRELYFLKGEDALDAAMLDGRRYPILQEVRDTARHLDFPFARIARAFRMIDDVMVPVLVPRDDRAERALDQLAVFNSPPRGLLRTLQQYVVPVPDTVRRAFMASGAVQPVAPEKYGGRFLRLVVPSLYTDALGLRLDDPHFRSAEENVI